MNNSLGIIAPHLGARSETFIQRHMEDLLPNQTVVLVRSNKGPYAGYWNTRNPKCLLDNYPPQPFEFMRSCAYKLTNIRRDNSFVLHRNYIIKRFLRKNPVKVLMGEYLDYTHAFIEPARELGIPIWGHAHGYDVSNQLLDKYWQQRYLDYNETEGIIAVNKISRQRLIKLGVKAEKIHIISCGVKTLDKCPLHRKSKEKIKCLAVGRMVRKKAPILLLKSFHHALQHNPTLQLDYVGTGELMHEVEAYITQHELSSQITLHGGLPNSEVHTLMKESDLFMQHSIVDPITGDEEGLPVAILEAMAHGLPVVSTKHAGIPDAVINGKTGILVSEEDVSGMGEGILNLSRDTDMRLNMGFEAWQRVNESFSWEHERQELLKCLKLI